MKALDRLVKLMLVSLDLLTDGIKNLIEGISGVAVGILLFPLVILCFLIEFFRGLFFKKYDEM